MIATTQRYRGFDVKKWNGFLYVTLRIGEDSVYLNEHGVPCRSTINRGLKNTRFKRLAAAQDAVDNFWRYVVRP